MNPFPQRSEKETTIADAQSSLGKTREQRLASFCDLMRTIDTLWTHLSDDEKELRRCAYRKIHARPTRWWERMHSTGEMTNDTVIDTTQ